MTSSTNGNGSGSGGQEVFLVAMDPAIAAYLLYLVSTDLASWPPHRKSRLQPGDIRPWALYLHDALPKRLRTPVP